MQTSLQSQDFRDGKSKMAALKFTQNAQNLISSQLSYQETSLKISDESLERFDWNLADKPKQALKKKVLGRKILNGHFKIYPECPKPNQISIVIPRNIPENFR